MKILLNKFKTGLIGIVGAGMLHIPAYAVDDVLNTPSMQTNLFKKFLELLSSQL